MGTTRGGQYGEIGSTGLSTWGGYIEQAYISELTWPRVASTYNRIWRSDPEVTIARNLYGALAGKVKIGWEFPEERGNKELPQPTKADEEFLDFLYSVCDDMEGGIAQWVTDCITRTPFYGYGLWEVVLGLRRKGWNADGWTSQENDDLTGIRSLAFRDYATFQRWHIDDKTGRPTAWEQNDPPNPITPIPLSRCLHIRYGDLSNPEGLATLEAMYRLERYKFNLEVIQGLGYEHSAGFLYFEADRAITGADETHLNRAARFVLTAQEGNYLATPGGIKAMFIDTPFGAAANILETIKHYSVLKLALLGLQFVAISTMTGSGSYAALDDSSSVAMLMYNSMTAGFARQAGQQIVDQMLKANPGAFQGITRKPIMTISPIAKTAALAELAQFVTAMNAIRPLGDDDLVSIRRQSEVLPVTLPEADNVGSVSTGTPGATVQAIATIVEQIRAGKMPMTAAVEALVFTGMLREVAEKIVNEASNMPEAEPPTLPDEPTQPVANEDDVMTTPDEGEPGELSEPIDPKGKATKGNGTGAKVTPQDAEAAVKKFRAWAKKNAPQYVELLDAEVMGEDES